ncbi:MAG: hypothetical protein QOI41_6244 [Myxococcales bacterium]|nr:hypothetical protein [Myxococcales bacterium]
MLAVIAASARAGAQTPAPATKLPIDLSWQAPPECPEASAIVQRVEQILAGPPPSSTIVTATAIVERLPSGRFSLTLAIRTGNVEETRTVDAASCVAVAQVTAVVIALAMDPSRPHETDGGETHIDASAPSPSAPSPSPPSPSPPSPSPPAAPRATSAAAPRAAFGVGGVVELGTLPQIGGGVAASVALRLARVRLGIRGALWARQHPIFDEPSGAGASFGMMQVGAWGAYVLPVGAFAFGPAAEVGASITRVEGFGIKDPHAAWSAWPTLALGGRGELGISRVIGLYAQADAVFPFARPTFTLGTSGSAVELHQPAWVAGRFGVGAEIVLP